MKTIGELLKLSHEFLAGKKIEHPRRTAEELIAHVLQLKRMDLYLQFDKPVIDAETQILREMLKKVANNTPLAYVFGELSFFHCRIKVDSRALIPRPETEILVEMISKRIENGTLWDICTGSGCIGIALKKKYPELDVTLSDICPNALALAKENAKLNNVDVKLVQGDLLTPFKGQKVDYIVCNPPYISAQDFAKLDPSVKDFEPSLALIGGTSGLECYEKIAASLPSGVKQIFFEIGFNQGEALKKIFPNGELHLDYAGHPRFFFV